MVEFISTTKVKPRMLAPAARSTPLSGSPWFRFSRSHTSYVGIDIGIDRVRMATFELQRDKVAGHAGHHSLHWTSHWDFHLPVDPTAPPPANWVDLVANSLVDRLPRCVDGDRNACVVSLPLSWIHYQTTAADEYQATQQQCDAMFTSSLFQSSAHVRHWPIVEGGDQFVISATAEQAACRIAEAIASVGYRLELILPHGVALLRVAQQLTSLQPAAVVVLELTGGMVAVAEQSQCGLCRNLPAANLQPGRDPFMDELEPWLQEIASEVIATFRYASRLGGSVDSAAPVLVCGGAAEIVGVDSTLATLLGRPVASWRYAGKDRPGCAAAGDENTVPVSDAGLAVSLSLASCAFDVSVSPRNKEAAKG